MIRVAFYKVVLDELFPNTAAGVYWKFIRIGIVVDER